MTKLLLPILFRLAAPSQIAIRLKAGFWFAGLLACLAPGIDALAADDIAQAGDILQYVLPGTAAGLTVVFRDWKGSLEFGESFALTEGVTYGLKYAVEERRPNGSSHSFPSA